MRVLFVGELPVPQSSSATLARALATEGFTAEFWESVKPKSTANWIKSVRECDAIIVVNYDGPDPFLIRQLSLAVTLGCPIIRWWVGTDVLYCLQHKRAAKQARSLNRVVSRNIAVAGHLVEELSTVGISAVTIPSIVDLDHIPGDGSPDHSLPKGILVYLPTDRREFYGLEVVQPIVVANPDLQFVVVADQDHVLACHPNVRSLGWVNSMEEIWPDIGVVLRVTEHDGLPRMVLDALLRGRYAIYAWPLAGCWLGQDEESVQAAIEQFRQTIDFNNTGRQAVRELLTPSPVVQFAEAIQEAVRERMWLCRATAAYHACRITGLLRIKRYLH